MRIVMRVNTSDENGFTAEAENAYVLLDVALAKLITSRFELFDRAHEADPGIVEMSFMSDSAECGFYNWLGFHDDKVGLLLGGKVEKDLEEIGWCEIPEDSTFKGDLSRDSFNEVFGIRADGTYMTVGEHGVCWEMHPKYGAIILYSALLPRELLQRVT